MGVARVISIMTDLERECEEKEHLSIMMKEDGWMLVVNSKGTSHQLFFAEHQRCEWLSFGWHSRPYAPHKNSSMLVNYTNRVVECGTCSALYPEKLIILEKIYDL